jgi:hypothetical protein
LSRGNRADRLASEEWFWAWEEVDEAMTREPAAAVALVAALVDAAPTLDDCAYIGAGPLEDLLNYQAEAVVDAVDDESRRNERFRRALAAVYIGDGIRGDIARRLRRFFNESP